MSELWKELHTRALDYKGNNDRVYLYKFAANIPRYTAGCKCKEFWTGWIRLNPPDYKNYFEWNCNEWNNWNNTKNYWGY